MDLPPTRFAQEHPNGRTFVHGRSDGFFLACVEPEWIYFRAEGDPPMEDFPEMFHRILPQQRQDTVALLVDLRRFTGTIDWNTLSRAHDTQDWSRFRTFLTAHLVRDSGFALLIKIINVIFPEACHKIFREEATAEAWLREQIRQNGTAATPESPENEGRRKTGAQDSGGKSDFA